MQTKRSYECARVEGVPPEEFGIARNARSIRDADYCFHDVLRSEAKLIEQGYDREQVKRLPSYVVADTIEAQARDTVDEGTQGQGDDGVNSASRLVRVTEHYVRMDYEGNDKPACIGSRPAATTARFSSATASRTSFRECDSVCGDDAGHRHASVLRPLDRRSGDGYPAHQDRAHARRCSTTSISPTIRASKWRRATPTETTLDDLLVSRPGGIVRTKMPGGLSVIQHPDIGGHRLSAAAVSGRHARDGAPASRGRAQGVDPNALQNQVGDHRQPDVRRRASQGEADRAHLCRDRHSRSVFAAARHDPQARQSQAQTVRLRNHWVTVDPRDWKARNDMTINVGLGTGGKTEQLAHLMSLIGLQKEALAAGKTNLVSDDNLYNAAKEFTKLVGLKNVDRYFTDPKTQPAPQPRGQIR